jgi:hypothetical protein
MKLVIAGLALVMCCGCRSVVDWQKALAGDQATVTGLVTSVYGTARFVRIGRPEPGQTIVATPDGTVTVRGPTLKIVPGIETTTTAKQPK